MRTCVQAANFAEFPSALGHPEAMANVIIRPGWHLSERLATRESAFLNRRAFLQQVGFASAGLLSASGIRNAQAASANSTNSAKGDRAALRDRYPAPRNPEFNPNWALTNEKVAGRYNNFYEFSLGKDVYRYVDKFVTAPGPGQVSGLGEKTLTMGALELTEWLGR